MKPAMVMLDGLRGGLVRPPHVNRLPADVADLKKLRKLHALRLASEYCI